MKQLDPTKNPLDKTRVILAGFCVLTTGALFFNLLPLILGLSADALMLSTSEIGWLGTGYLLAFALISPLGVYLMRQYSWMGIFIICTLFSSFCFIGATKVNSFSALLVVFFLLGLGKGLLWAQGNRILAASSDPDRIFGFGALISLLIPTALMFFYVHLVAPRWGFNGVMLLTALLLASSLLVAAWFPSGREIKQSKSVENSSQLTPEVILGLLCMVGVFLSSSGLWAFLERIGVSKQIETVEIGHTLTAGVFFMAIASLLPMLTEGRASRSSMLFVMFVLALIAMLLFSQPSTILTFFIATALFTFAFSASVVYAAAVIADADNSGDFLILNSGAAGFGAALGPVIAGYLVIDDNYNYVLIMSGVVFLITAVLARKSETLVNRRAVSGQPSVT